MNSTDIYVVLSQRIAQTVSLIKLALSSRAITEAGPVVHHTLDVLHNLLEEIMELDILYRQRKKLEFLPPQVSEKNQAVE